MNINNEYEKYTNNKVSLIELKDKIIEYAYQRVSWERYIEPGDFLILFIPVAEDIILNYESNRCKFTHYINKRIEWLKLQQKKEYIIKNEKITAYQNQSEMEYLDRTMVQESIPEYSITKEAKLFFKIYNGEINKKSVKKKFLIFVLKCSRLLDDNLIQSICNICGEPTSWLYKMKDSLDKLGEDRIKNRDYLVHRNNRLFLEINRDQQKLNVIQKNGDRDRLKIKISQMRERKLEIQDTLNRRNYGPKNEEIAKVLGIPKGTVDSSLFYMKKELTSLFHGKKID